MNYVYAAMWLIAGILLIFRMGKENKVFYVAGGFFLLLGGWWLAAAMNPSLNVFGGSSGIILRIITAAALVVLCYVFFKEIRTSNAAQKAKKDESLPDGSSKAKDKNDSNNGGDNG